MLVPAPPTVKLPGDAETDSDAGTLVDEELNFLTIRYQAGRPARILYSRSLASLRSTPARRSRSGQEPTLQLDNDPLIRSRSLRTCCCGCRRVRQRAGRHYVAAYNGRLLRAGPSRRISLAANSAALAVLSIATLTNDHPAKARTSCRRVAATTSWCLPRRLSRAASSPRTYYASAGT